MQRFLITTLGLQVDKPVSQTRSPHPQVPRDQCFSTHLLTTRSHRRQAFKIFSWKSDGLCACCSEFQIFSLTSQHFHYKNNTPMTAKKQWNGKKELPINSRINEGFRKCHLLVKYYRQGPGLEIQLTTNSALKAGMVVVTQAMFCAEQSPSSLCRIGQWPRALLLRGVLALP